MESLERIIAGGDQLNQQCIDFLKRKIIDAYKKNPGKEIIIYLSLKDMLGLSQSKDENGKVITTYNGFNFLPEDDSFGMYESIKDGERFRTKDELKKLIKRKWSDDEIIAYFMALEKQKFITQATYIYYGNSSRRVNGKSVREHYHHLHAEDSKLNMYSSLFRKGSDNSVIDRGGARFEMEEVLPEEYFVTRELLLFRVGYYRIALPSDFIEKCGGDCEMPQEEIHQLGKGWAVNEDKGTFFRGDVTKHASKIYRGEPCKYWTDLLLLLHNGSISMGKYEYGSPEQQEFNKRYRNLNKVLKKITGESLVTISVGVMKLKDVKKG